MSRRRGVIVALALAAAAVAELTTVAGSAPSERPGRIQIVRNAAHGFDSFLRHSSPAQRSFMRSHYWRVRGYTPSFDGALGWAPPSHVYVDLYALYPSRKRDRRIMRRHPNWVLRNAAGRRLYIPYGCDGDRCTAYAANPGSAGWRKRWIAHARRQVRKGYAGLFIDNVNLEMRVGDGAGRPATPVDPRTEAPMTIAAWRNYVAGFTERIRAELPGAEIVHNAIWFTARDAAAARQARAADIVELERGCSDPGLVAGDGRFGIETFLSHIDWLHSLGASVLLEPYGREAARREYDVACYFLISSGQDAMASAFQTDPGDWWRGWDVQLGAPLGGRYVWNDVLRRDFTNGYVLLNQPGQPSRSLPINGSFQDPVGRPRLGSLTLGGGQGSVLIESP